MNLVGHQDQQRNWRLIHRSECPQLMGNNAFCSYIFTILSTTDEHLDNKQ